MPELWSYVIPRSIVRVSGLHTGVQVCAPPPTLQMEYEVCFSIFVRYLVMRGGVVYFATL